MKVLFIFDRVMHYHVDLFQQLEVMLEKNNNSLYLLSGYQKKLNGGREGLNKKIIKNQKFFNFFELKLGTYTLKYQIGIVKYIFNVKPDIVVEQSHVGNFSIWLIGILRKVIKFKLVSWQCGYEYNDTKLKHIFTKIFLKNFDYHLAYHTNALNYLLNYNVNKENVKIIFNTINEKKVKILDKNIARENLYKIYPETINKNIILFVGAVLKEKKLELLIESFILLNDKESILIIVGSGEHLENLKSTYGFNKNIIFTGKILQGIELYFDSADIFVLPGTGGLAINEALIHSLPVISGYADGSADDLVINNVNGFRLQKYSTQELSDYINILLKDKNLRTIMGINSKKMYLEKFSFESFINNIYEGLLTSFKLI